MSDSADEFQEGMEVSALQIGDSVTAYTYPLTEGLIVDRKLSEEGRLTLTLLIALHKKKGKHWSASRSSLRDAARLSKKPSTRFYFPIKGVEKLREEAKKMKADPSWMATIRATLDKDFQQHRLSSDDSGLDQKGDEEDSDEVTKDTEHQAKEAGEISTEQKFAELERRVGEVLQLRGIKEASKKKDKKEKERDDSDFEQWRKWKQEKKRRKKKNKRKRARSSSSSSFASSSSSSSEEELRPGEVREKISSGIFACPFAKTDIRGFKDVKAYVQGQADTRRNVRIALQNLYGAHHTLAAFADKMVAKAHASPYRPFTMDAAWFQAYAENIDMLLLNSLQGPWALWSEPIIDDLVTGFLELLIRVSPYKNYPACLEDSVRKWIKKKRIGTDTKFGPISYAMQHAKFTEGRVVLSQGGVQRSREKPTSLSKQGMVNNTRGGASSSIGGEKRPPPPS